MAATYIVIDDEPLVRKGLLKKIQSYGRELICLGEADNGEDALELIRETDPDLIFTDMRMPVMDGKSLLRVLQRDYSDKKIIVISGHTDFDYMQEAISAKVVGYLLKPFSREEIHGVIEKALGALEREQASRQEAETRTEEKEKLELAADRQSLINLILGVHTRDGMPELRSVKLQGVREAAALHLMMIYRMDKGTPAPLEEAFPELVFLPHPSSGQLILVLQACRDAARLSPGEQAKQAAAELLDFIGSNPGSRACIGISSSKSGLALLPQAYGECITALNRRTVADYGRLFECQQEAPLPEIALWDKRQDLLFFIEAGRADGVRDLVLDFFAFYVRQPHATLAQLKGQCRDIVLEVKRLLAQYLQVQGDDSRSASMELVLNVSFDLEAIRDYFLAVLPDIAELLKDRSVYSSDNAAENIKTYIRKNYTYPLTLERVSSLFYLNPSYLSYLFKEKTGENFTDYINGLRIEEAKKRLISGDDKVYKLAKTLGFDNPKYFFRLFKKKTGFTPEEYRKAERQR